MIRFKNGGELFDFQKNASSWLLDNTGSDSERDTLILKAPTGSGKTIILLNYIDDYFNYSYQKTSFIWLTIGAGELEEQSKEKMDSLLPQRSSNTLSEALQTGFQGGDVTFINWESVTRKGNRALKEGEIKNIKDRIADAHKEGTEFILIIDEEHRNKTSLANEFMDYFSALNTIRVSATTLKDERAYEYEIPESEVIASGLITKAIYVNQDVEDSRETTMNNEHEYLLDLAIKKREEIQKEYDKINKNIRPLIIIQFPDSSEEKIKSVEEYLEKQGYTYNNKFVSRWLSGDQINTESLEEPNATPLFLLWKQALSTGWDCPRAKILIKLRENMLESFETQTIGRIRRMPEAKHYNNELLDNCFMYTFDEEWKNQALKEPYSYETREVFIKPEMKQYSLTKEVRDSSSYSYGEREIREVLSNYIAEKYKLEKGNNKSINVKRENKNKMEADSWIFTTRLERVYLKGKFVKVSDLLEKDPTKLGKVSREVNTHDHGLEKMHIINELHGIISISDSAIQSIIRTLFHKSEFRRADNILALENKEWYAFIINNRDELKKVFREIKSTKIKSEVNLNIRFSKEQVFRIPHSEIYKIDSSRKDLLNEVFNKNVYKQYEKSMVTDNTRSLIEQKFEYYCERNQSVKWFYKNGDKGDKYFSIAYQDGFGQIRLFYPDYLVQTENNQVWLIETKGGELSGQSQDIDIMSEIKFNAFKKYALRHPNIEWGFVRNIGEELYLNNTKWEEPMTTGSSWLPINTYIQRKIPGSLPDQE